MNKILTWQKGTKKKIKIYQNSQRKHLTVWWHPPMFLYAYLHICRQILSYLKEITLYWLFWNTLLFSQPFVPDILPYPTIESYFLVWQAAVYSFESMYHNLLNYLGCFWIPTNINKATMSILWWHLFSLIHLFLLNKFLYVRFFGLFYAYWQTIL